MGEEKQNKKERSVSEMRKDRRKEKNSAERRWQRTSRDYALQKKKKKKLRAETFIATEGENNKKKGTTKNPVSCGETSVKCY